MSDITIIEDTIQQTVQDRARENPEESSGASIVSERIYSIAQINDIIPPWWSRARDTALNKFWKDIDWIEYTTKKKDKS